MKPAEYKALYEKYDAIPSQGLYLTLLRGVRGRSRELTSPGCHACAVGIRILDHCQGNVYEARQLIELDAHGSLPGPREFWEGLDNGFSHYIRISEVEQIPPLCPDNQDYMAGWTEGRELAGSLFSDK
jgi:hypothetical protein